MLILIFFSLMSFSEGGELLMSTGPGWSMKPLPINAVHTREQHWMKFQIKTSSGLYIGLQTFYEDTVDMFEVYVEAVDHCGLKKVGAPSSLVRIPCSGIIAATEYRPLWVTWEGGVIAVGTGTELGENVIASLTDPFPIDVHYLAVSGDAAEWRIETSTPICPTYMKLEHTKAEALYNPDPRMLTHTEVSPSLNGCSRECLYLIWCRGFSYSLSLQECRMYDTAPPSQNLTLETGWDTWNMIK